jgi:hypothetical protein
MVKIDPKELGLLRRLSQLDLESNSSTSTAIIAVLSVVGTLVCIIWIIILIVRLLNLLALRKLKPADIAPKPLKKIKRKKKKHRVQRVLPGGVYQDGFHKQYSEPSAGGDWTIKDEESDDDGDEWAHIKSKKEDKQKEKARKLFMGTQVATQTGTKIGMIDADLRVNKRKETEKKSGQHLEPDVDHFAHQLNLK